MMRIRHYIRKDVSESVRNLIMALGRYRNTLRIESQSGSGPTSLALYRPHPYRPITEYAIILHKISSSLYKMNDARATLWIVLHITKITFAWKNFVYKQKCFIEHRQNEIQAKKTIQFQFSIKKYIHFA